MQLTEFQSGSIWKCKFVNLKVDLENIKKERLEMGVQEKTQKTKC